MKKKEVSKKPKAQMIEIIKIIKDLEIRYSNDLEIRMIKKIYDLE